ncbi:MAG: O-antigen ligase family protein [Actinomycetia bacterium]|nr:O-antigen ligase family protein [Actinomycetes bacterium]
MTLFLTVALVTCTVLAMVYQDAFTGLEVVPVGSFGLTPFDCVFYLTLVLLVVGLFFRRTLPLGGAGRVVGGISIAYAAYQVLVVAPVAMVTWGYSPIGALYQIAPRLSILLVLFFAFLVTRYWNGNVVRGILECAALVLLAVALWRFVTGTRVFVEAGTGRLRVLWGGGSLLFGWLVISRLLRQRVRIRDLAIGGAGLVGVVLINHRSAYIALAAGFVAFMLMSWRKIPRTVGIVVAIIVLVGAVVYTFLPTLGTGLEYSLTTMFEAGSDAGTVDRMYRYRLGLEQFAANPFGDVVWRGSYYLVHFRPGDDYAPHNFVVQLLAGEGLVGFLLWSALLTVCLVVALRNSRRDHDSAVLASYVIFYLTFCLFNTNFHMIDNVVLLVAPLGLILWRNRVVAALEPQVSRQSELVPGPEVAPAEAGRPAVRWSNGTR